MTTPGAGSGRILQVHPTRLCNLSCAHCYSSSSPQVRTGLRPDHVALAVDDAARLGFRVLSLSGGEPLAYDGLEEVVAAAKQSGCQVNLVSNGILIGSARFDRVQASLGVVALSLDGLPERHNAIRRSATSFERVCAAAYLLRQRRQPFGIIHTLTSESLDEIESLAAIASDWGASLLQLHPFEPSGRGAQVSGMTPLSADERVTAYILAAALGHEYPHMRVQADLVHRDVARFAPAALHGAPLDECGTPHELVLQDDGTVVPLTYGLDRAWAIVDVTRGRLADALPGYLAGTWPQLRRRTRAAAIAVARGRQGEVVAWHEVVRRFAQTRRVMALETISA